MQAKFLKVALWRVHLVRRHALGESRPEAIKADCHDLPYLAIKHLGRDIATRVVELQSCPVLSIVFVEYLGRNVQDEHRLGREVPIFQALKLGYRIIGNKKDTIPLGQLDVTSKGHEHTGHTQGPPQHFHSIPVVVRPDGGIAQSQNRSSNVGIAYDKVSPVRPSPRDHAANPLTFYHQAFSPLPKLDTPVLPHFLYQQIGHSTVATFQVLRVRGTITGDGAVQASVIRRQMPRTGA
jgi:hypothetical protein